MMSNHLPQPLFAADFWALFNFGDPNARYQAQLNTAQPSFKHLIEGVLLYPKVVLPTQDYLTLSVLVGVLGQRAVIHLLESRRIAFIRVKGALAYIGNGGGIQAYSIQSPVGAPSAFCAPVPDAIQWALRGLAIDSIDPSLPRLVEQATLELDANSLVDDVRKETYADILSSPLLQQSFSVLNTDLDHLAGIEPNQVRIYGGPQIAWSGDEIDAVLALAATNLELRLAEAVQCLDASTASPMGHMLKAKAGRVFESSESAKSFSELCEIANVPDIGEAVLQNAVSVEQIVRLSDTRNAAEFRTWFHAHCRDNPLETAKQYVELLRDTPRIQTVPAKIIRLIVTTLVGLIPIIGQIVGPAASALDSFYIERVLRGHSPKYFIDELRQIETHSPRRDTSNDA